jgi:hypothetical protein
VDPRVVLGALQKRIFFGISTSFAQDCPAHSPVTVLTELSELLFKLHNWHLHFLIFSGYRVQWNLDLSFFKGMEKQNNECGKSINPGNYYTL